ncbi:copper amine oxidase N-terminal domain-containing protein [Paenibacillus sp. p3-SID867]|uniref:copper amine oxidase N-terminal domain-containing protein n=1 Tax=Paenibacillus sp. p3-SID867 TaxID=2916363 RepID=UPI0021A32955|nr:copper amine oxidase N-terminal domain-containing protein [Paenibacillus sp. p3-SID867]MCT1400107.1 copper amine oxidase N-terminal domain-containing protein [Paenibacillus sp. p3-SID867]
MKKEVTNKVSKWNVKLLVIALISMTWLGLCDPIPAEADSAVGGPKLAVLVDGRKVKFQGGDPVFENGRVQVPLRGIGEALKAEIGFRGKTVTYMKDGKSIALTLGSKEAIVNGKNVTMDTAAKAVKGRTYVPLRFVSENLGVPVNWDKVGNWVWIGSKEVPTIDEAGIEKLPMSKRFIDLFSTKKFYIDNKSSVQVFTLNDLPLEIGDRIIYDVWPVKFGEYQSLRIRYSNFRANIFYLGDQVRSRGNTNYLINKDKSVTITYQTTSEGDDLRDGDKNYKSFKLNKALYIGFDIGTDSLILLQNPFK